MFRVSLAASALALLTVSSAALADPPGRVARMSYIRGEVGFQPGGSGEWVDAAINRPLVAGDRLSTDRDARLELEIGAGSIRIDERSAVSLLAIDDRITQIELTDGTLNLSIRRLLEGQTYEVDTPTLAFVVSQPGEYRVDVAPDGDSTMVTVFRGNGDVYGENDASYRVRDRQSYRFNDAGLRDYEVLDLPAVDDFDRWCLERNDRYERAVSSQYVSDEVVGYADLDGYGSWSNVDTYGSVWYPRSVAADWAPYRDGHWAWIDPWGWSWVDDQPWGFAPSHYGRWVQVSNRWGWVPGPRHLRPVYAPALVAFVGGSNWGVSIGSNPVGWFPLGPRDVYRPWYNCSQDYFSRVNLRNSRNFTNVTVINVYNDYSRGRPFRGDYAYRRDARAFTAVPGNVFAGARPVGRDRLRIGADAWGRGQVVNHVGIGPNRDSLAARGNGRFRAPQGDHFDRRVVARNAPPAAVLPFAQRENMIRNNGNRPLGIDQMRGPGRGGDNRSGGRDNDRIRVVDRDNRAQPRDLPGVGGRGAANRDERAAQPGRNAAGAIDRRDANDRVAPRDADRFNGRSDNPRNPGDPGERRVGERAGREDNGQLRSSRFAPGQRERQQDPRREAGNPDVRDGGNRPGVGQRDNDGDANPRNVRQQRGDMDRTRSVTNPRSDDAAEGIVLPRSSQQREQRVGRDMDAEREQARQQRNIADGQREQQQRNAALERQQSQRDMGAEREQARQQRQAASDQQREQRAGMQEQQRGAAMERQQQSQRDVGAQREQARQQRQAASDQQREQRAAMQEQQRGAAVERQQRNDMQEQRRNQMEQQRSQQAERMQMQQQQRAEQAGRMQEQQQQRQQQQQQRQMQQQQQQQEQQQRQQAQPQPAEQKQQRGNRREREDKQEQ